MGRTGESRRRRRRVSAARGFRVTLSVAALAVASASLARVWIRTVVAGEGWRWRSCVSSNDACRRTCRIKLSEFVTTAGDRVPFYSWVSGSLCGADLDRYRLPLGQRVRWRQPGGHLRQLEVRSAL
jgi:hypothetical protein